MHGFNIYHMPSSRVTRASSSTSLCRLWCARGTCAHPSPRYGKRRASFASACVCVVSACACESVMCLPGTNSSGGVHLRETSARTRAALVDVDVCRQHGAACETHFFLVGVLGRNRHTVCTNRLKHVCVSVSVCAIILRCCF